MIKITIIWITLCSTYWTTVHHSTYDCQGCLSPSACWRPNKCFHSGSGPWNPATVPPWLAQSEELHDQPHLFSLAHTLGRPKTLSQIMFLPHTNTLQTHLAQSSVDFELINIKLSVSYNSMDTIESRWNLIPLTLPSLKGWARPSPCSWWLPTHGMCPFRFLYGSSSPLQSPNSSIQGEPHKPQDLPAGPAHHRDRPENPTRKETIFFF